MRTIIMSLFISMVLAIPASAMNLSSVAGTYFVTLENMTTTPYDLKIDPKGSIKLFERGSDGGMVCEGKVLSESKFPVLKSSVDCMPCAKAENKEQIESCFEELESTDEKARYTQTIDLTDSKLEEKVFTASINSSLFGDSGPQKGTFQRINEDINALTGVYIIPPSSPDSQKMYGFEVNPKGLPEGIKLFKLKFAGESKGISTCTGKIAQSLESKSDFTISVSCIDCGVEPARNTLKFKEQVKTCITTLEETPEDKKVSHETRN